MKQLPQHGLQATPAWQKERLCLWLADWKADRTLAETVTDHVPDLLTAGRSRRLQDSVAPTDARQPLAAQQIRLLHPANSPAADRPVYIALLEPSAHDGWWVAPFGRFAEPAVPGEWRTGRQAPPLQVLCLWNTRRLSMQQLQESWLVDELSEMESASGLIVWRHLREQAPLPVDLTRAVGPPLIHPLDPRWDYLDEETRLVSGWSERVNASSLRYPSATARETVELALAAESRSPYRLIRAYQIEALGLKLQVTPGAEPTSHLVQIVDDENHLVTRMDGSVLRRPDGSCSAAIRQGGMHAPADWIIDGTTFIDPSGQAHRLRSV